MAWRAIPGFSRYEVSTLGEVRHAISRRHLVQGSRTDSGYLRVTIAGRLMRVHRLVLLAHAGPPPTRRHHGAHKNGNKDDNRLHNLAWKLPHANEADKRRHGTAPTGGARQATPIHVVRRIRSRVQQGHSFSALARRYGLHRSSISRIARGLRRAA